MTAETSNARGEWVLVPREPTQAMREAFNDWRPTEGNNYAGAQSFSAQERWAFRQRYAALLAAAPQPPSAPVGVRNAILEALNLVHAEGRARVESATAEMADRLAALAQQPAAVDEAMVERALRAWREAVVVHEGNKPAIRAALTAALAAQHQEPKS